MTFNDLIGLIKSDLYRYMATKNFRAFLKAWIFCPGFRVTALYRFESYLYYDCKILYKIIGWFVRFVSLHYRYVYGIELPVGAKVGKGLYIGHFGGIIISSAAIIGDNCNLSQEVTIGISGIGENRGVPEIGNEVYIGPGAKLFGKITIGDRCVIGANSVVNRALLPGRTYGGIPIKELSNNSSCNIIINKA